MIYDVFLYCGEEEMMDLRIAELEGDVDVFVVVESSRTFRGDRCSPNDRTATLDMDSNVRRLMVNPPAFTQPWAAEAFVRQQALLGMPELKADDIVTIADVDEIPDVRNIGKTGTHAMNCFIYSMRNRNLNRLMCSVTVTGEELLAGRSLQDIRNDRARRPLLDGGWHLSFFGGAEAVSRKIKSFSHHEFDQPVFTDPYAIRIRMERGIDPFDRIEDEKYERLSEVPRYRPRTFDSFKDFLDPA